MKSIRFIRSVLTLALALAGTVWAQRTVSVAVTGSQITGTGTASIVLASLGDENAVGFSVTFNPAVLRYDSFTAGTGVTGATINPNVSQTLTGKVGFAIAQSAGVAFSAGSKQLVVLNFTALTAAASETIGFGNVPILREVSDVTANEITAVTYTPLTIAVSLPPAAPTITTPPQSQTVVAGATVMFSVTATGNPSPTTFVWKKNGTTTITDGPAGSGAVITGATTAMMHINGVTATEAGSYTVTVGNTVSPDATSTPAATLTVNPALSTTLAVATKISTLGVAVAAFTPVTPAGGTPGYTYAVNPALPAGLNLSVSSGAISGTPSAAASAADYTITVTDSASATSAKTFSLTVNPAVVATQAVPSTTLTAGTAVTPFTPVTAAGGTAPRTFAITPALPATLTMNTATGIISGTPAAALATTTFTVTVSDSLGATTPQTFSLTVNGPVTTNQVLATKALTAGTAAVAFTPVTAAGGTAPLVFTISPALPASLSINSGTGAITGTPAAVLAATTYTVTATDSTSASSGKTFSLTVNAAPTSTQVVLSKALTAGTAAVAFTPVTATGGTAPLTYSVSPALPTVLTLSASTGAVTGTPGASAALATYTVTATDASGAVTSKTFDLTVNPALIAAGATVSSKVLTAGAVAVPFNAFSLSQGTPAYTYSVSPALPSGLAIGAVAGAISGTPTAAVAAANYTITGTDSVGAQVSQTLNLLVNPALTATLAVASKTLNVGTAAVAFTPVTPGGGTAGFTYNINPVLPAGLALNAATGEITGTPTAAAAASYTVTIADSANATAQQTFSLTVNGPLTANQMVASKTLTASTVAVAFTPVAAGGGTSPYAYAVSPTLPSGLALATTTGAVTGTPASAISATTYTVTITDSVTATANSTFSLTVSPALTSTLAVATKVLTKDTAAVAFTPVTIAGGTTPVGFAVSPALPAGLALNPATGEITGTPTAASAVANYTVTATDIVGATTNRIFSLTVNAVLAPVAGQTISSKALTAGTAALAFTPLPLSGGSTPFAYTVTPALPAGLTLNATSGAISGTATSAAASANYIITGTDAAGAFVNQTLALLVNPTLLATQAVATRILTANAVAAAFTPVTTSGGTAPVSMAVAPALPAGLTLNAATGEITGTPTVAAAAANYTVTATDNVGATANRTFNLTVNGALVAVAGQTISSKALTAGTAAVAFTPLPLSGGSTPFAYTVTPALPAGLALNASTGAITGTATGAAVAANYTITGTDAAGAFVNQVLALTVNSTLVAVQAVSDRTLTANAVTAVFKPVTLTGGTAPFTFTVAPVLPGGLSFAAASGEVSGIPTTSTASATYTVSITDSAGAVVTQTFTLYVQPAVPIITSSAAAAAVAGTSFSYTVTATPSPVTFTAAGLPGWLTLTSGVLSGTPTEAGVTTVAITATNGTGAATLPLVINTTLPANAPAYVGTLNPAGTAGVAFTFTPNFGTGTTTYALTGTLPTGLAFNAGNGVISGTTQQTGLFPVTVSATRVGLTATARLTITVNPSATAPVVSVTGGNVRSATVGTAFGPVTLTAIPAPTSFTIGTLPLGFSVGGTGTVPTISGTPTATPGTYNVAISATNTAGTGPTATLVITINPHPQAPMVTSAPAVQGRVLVPLTYTLAATPSTTPPGPTTYGMTGTLPSGLTFDGTAGTVAGTPAVGTMGSYPVFFAGTNTNGIGLALQVTFNIAPPLTVPVINSNGTAAAQVGQAFNYQITATNTPTGYDAASLPVGLTVNTATGMISGVPTTATGEIPANVSLTAININGTSNPKLLAITIVPARSTAVITSAATATGRVGSAFTYQMTASETPTSYVALALPPGLLVNPLSGAITGTPTQSGTFIASLRAANGAGLGAATSLTITIAPAPSAPAITSPATVVGQVGTALPFTYQIVAAPGPITGYAYTYTGAIPNWTLNTIGLALNTATGLISGSPTQPGSFSISLTATSDGGTSVPQNLSITINPAANVPLITSAGRVTGSVGTPFSYQIAATNPPHVTLDAVNLPAGLAVNPFTGVIQGIPTAVATTVASLVGTNASGTGPSRDITIVIEPAATAPVVTGANQVAAQVGANFTYQITATGSPSSYEVVGAPAWMTLNTSTGAIAGTPTAPGTLPVLLLATNSAGTSAPKLFVITIAPGANTPVLTSSRTALGVVGSVFAGYTLAATPAATSFVATGLPPGLSLVFTSPNWVITGTPTASGVYPVNVFASNANGVGAPGIVVITITANITFGQ